MSDFWVGFSFVSGAIFTGALKNIIWEPKNVVDELGTLATGFSGGIVGILIANYVMTQL